MLISVKSHTPSIRCIINNRLTPCISQSLPTICIKSQREKKRFFLPTTNGLMLKIDLKRCHPSLKKAKWQCIFTLNNGKKTHTGQVGHPETEQTFFSANFSFLPGTLAKCGWPIATDQTWTVDKSKAAAKKYAQISYATHHYLSLFHFISIGTYYCVKLRARWNS